MKNLNYFLSLSLCGLFFSCEESDETVTCPDNFAINTSEVINASCDASNGSISLTSTGAQGAVSYQLDGGASQTDNTFTALSPGTYQISAEDAEGCTASLSVTVQNEEVEITTSTTTNSSECGEAEGAITVDASGGATPYNYSLDGENFQTENEFASLEPGEYTVTVKDANGCIGELMASVDSEISFSARISDVINTNCAVNGCHVAGTGLPNFTVKENILDRAVAIKNRTGSKAMPPPSSERSLTDSQIEDIACWVDSGAPDN